MLDILRANTKSAFTWLIVVGIVVVFAINFGPGSLSKGSGGGCSGGTAPIAATVNGKHIPAAEWERAYRQLYTYYARQAGDVPQELLAQLQIPKQAMDQIVDRELVVQEARRRGLIVGKDELTRAVHAIPAFQENGQFSFALYEDSARQSYGSAAKFEASLKDELLFQKMMDAVRTTVKVSEAEVREAWEAEADRVSLRFVRVPLAAAEAAVKAPTEAEVKAFAEKESARIARFHQENPARFDQKKKVRVRHVLARVEGQDDGPARKKIADAQARVAKGEDFAKVAAAVSDDAGSRSRGGDVGFVSEGLFDDAFAKAALALEKGQVSEPVRAANGWHLIKAEEVVPAKVIPLEDARASIARELLVKDRAASLARERAQAALDAARAGKPLAAVKVGNQTASPEETGPFGRTSPFVPKIGEAQGLLADAFAAKGGQALPKVYDSPSGPVVATVVKRETPDPKAFEGQREQLETRVRLRKETQQQGAWLKALRAGAKVEENAQLLAASAAGPQ